jgi:ABC-type sugar transport system ATPase subunit
MENPILKIQDYSIRRGNFLLENVNLCIFEKEIFAILGKSGAGKTVLLESIAGFHPPTKGSILLHGRNVRNIPFQKRNIGFVYQDYGLFPHLSVRSNIEYGLRMRGCQRKEIEEKTDFMMDLFSISHIAAQSPKNISGGECQRTALARALILEPELLLLDEPFSALDCSTKKKMYGELLKVHDKFSCTIVFVTHDFSEAQLLADRIGIILDGSLKAVVSSKNLMDNHYDEDVEIFLGRE